jgi:hypothetical protein
MPKLERKRCKTFPIEIPSDLHKALKYRAIEVDQTLHTFIIEALVSKVQETETKYQAPVRSNGNSSEKRK